MAVKEMATTEERVDKLEIRFATLSEQFAATMAKVDTIIGEMRDRDNQRITEIQAMQQKHDADMKDMRQKHNADMKDMRQKHDADMKEIHQKHDADMKELREDIKGTIKHIQGLTIASMVGIMAIAIGVLGFLWITALDMKSSPPQPPTQTAQYQMRE